MSNTLQPRERFGRMRAGWSVRRVQFRQLQYADGQFVYLQDDRRSGILNGAENEEDEDEEETHDNEVGIGESETDGEESEISENESELEPTDRDRDFSEDYTVSQYAMEARDVIVSYTKLMVTELKNRPNATWRPDFRLAVQSVSRMVSTGRTDGGRTDFWHHDHRRHNEAYQIEITDVRPTDYIELNKKHQEYRQERRRGFRRVSYVYYADAGIIRANISTKSDWLMVDCLRGLIRTKANQVNRRKPGYGMKLRATPSALISEETIHPMNDDPLATTLLSAGCGSVSFLPRVRALELKHSSRRPAEVWPTVVVECGLLLGDNVLREKAEWWFAASRGRVRVVLTVQLETVWGRPRQLVIEQWTCSRQDSDMQAASRVEICLRPELYACPPSTQFGTASFTPGRSSSMGDVVLRGDDVFDIQVAMEAPGARDIVLRQRELRGLCAMLWNTQTFWDEAQAGGGMYWHDQMDVESQRQR